MELPELEFNLPKQLEIKRLVEEVLYGYEVTTKETALVTSDLEDRINYFLATKKLEGLSEATLKNYRYNLRKLCKFFNKPVSMITSDDIKMFMYSESSTKSPAGMNTFMTPIKLFFVWLQNEEFIIKNPCSSIKPVKEPKREKQPLTEEQVEMLRDCILSRRDRAILEFFLSSGCRVAEVGNVKVSDLDMTNKVLCVISKSFTLTLPTSATLQPVLKKNSNIALSLLLSIQSLNISTCSSLSGFFSLLGSLTGFIEEHGFLIINSSF